jgi:MEDS: MEthanogen/methylotroph, DcmR Sensory domain
MSDHFHAVRFYENKESLCRIVAEFLGEGFVAGQPGLVIATPAHCAGVLEALRARHVNVDEMQAKGDLLVVDARESMSAFLVNGLPHHDRFMSSMTTIITRLIAGRADCPIRAYGEMVDVLWKDGRPVAAVQLEMLWNKLAMTQNFSLLCGYGMGNFYKDASIQDICDQHSHLVAVDGSTSIIPARPQIN